MTISTLYSNRDEFIKDLDLYSKIVSAPQQGIEEIRDILYEEFRRAEPSVISEESRNFISEPVKPVGKIYYDNLIIGENEVLLDLSRSGTDIMIDDSDLEPIAENIKGLFSYSSRVTDSIRQKILSTYDLVSGENLESGVVSDKEFCLRDNDDFEDESKHDYDLEEEEYEDYEESEDLEEDYEESEDLEEDYYDEDSEGFYDEDSDLEEYEDDGDLETGAEYDSDEEYDSNEDFNEEEFEVAEDYDESDYIVADEFEEVSSEEESDIGTEDFDEELYDEDYDEESPEEEELYDDEELLEEEELYDEESSGEDYETESYGEGEASFEDGEYFDEDGDSLEDEEFYDEYSDEDDELYVVSNEDTEFYEDDSLSEVSETNEIVEDLEQNFDSNESSSKSGVEVKEESFVIPVDDVQEEVHTIKKLEGGSAQEKENVVDLSEPTDIRLFLKKHPNSSYDFALKYFTKKQINDAIRIGRIIKKGNILKV